MNEDFLIPEIDGAYRAIKHEVFFDFFKVKTTNVTWYATEHKNLALFYGKDKKVLESFLHDLVRQGAKKYNSTLLRVFDRVEDSNVAPLVAEFSSKRDPRFDVRVIKDSSSFESRIASLVSYQMDIEKLTTDAKMVESANKKMDIILLHLSAGDVSALRLNKTLQSSFISLLSTMRRQRIALFVLFENASLFPKEVVEVFDWVASIGVDAAFARSEFFSELNDTTYDINQVVIGNLYRKGIDDLSVIHPRKFTESEWRIQENIRLEEEKITYEAYLNSLDDGSV